jgi:hypothetical protein
MKVIKQRGVGLADFEFDPKVLQQAYRSIPPIVLADLAELCFSNRPTFDPDPRVDARQSGMRDVWLHINNYLLLSPDALETIYEGRGHLLADYNEVTDG